MATSCSLPAVAPTTQTLSTSTPSSFTIQNKLQLTTTFRRQEEPRQPGKTFPIKLEMVLKIYSRNIVRLTWGVPKTRQRGIEMLKTSLNWFPVRDIIWITDLIRYTHWWKKTTKDSLNTWEVYQIIRVMERWQRPSLISASKLTISINNLMKIWVS